MSRTHIVLVPGFVGFDAIGQLQYYAGVTEVFERWRKSEDARDREPTLHYFDNFPTASVEMRAERLCDFLLKRVARGEFSGDDRVTLIGHSTGGLDIRKAVWHLAQHDGGGITVDVTTHVDHGRVLHYLKHLVFLSVPHYGTNLGDFGCKLAASVQGVVRDAGLFLQLNREPLATLRRVVERVIARPDASDLLRAILDALNESDENRGADEPQRAAEREARAELALWLEHMGKDFSVIGDLRSASGVHDGSRSPAHFTEEERIAEMASWQAHDISTASYASVVRRRPDQPGDVAKWLVPSLKAGAPVINAFSRLLNTAAGLWWLPPAAVPAVLARATIPALAAPPAWHLIRRHPAAVFDACYALCADPSGPFRVEPDDIAPDAIDLLTDRMVPASELAFSDSDGVVNTLSMLWPFAPDDPARHPHYMVEADHGDIIGHYQLRPREPRTRRDRAYETYDIFPSGSGFDDQRFERVWTHVFDSCP